MHAGEAQGGAHDGTRPGQLRRSARPGSRDESLYRQERPLGHPGSPRRYTGSATSVAFWVPSTDWSGCQYGVSSTPPCLLVQCEAVTNDFSVPLVALKPTLQRYPGKLIWTPARTGRSTTFWRLGVRTIGSAGTMTTASSGMPARSVACRARAMALMFSTPIRTRLMVSSLSRYTAPGMSSTSALASSFHFSTFWLRYLPSRTRMAAGAIPCLLA